MLKQFNLSISIFLISISSLSASSVLLKFKVFVSKDVQLQIIEQSSATVSGFIEEISVWKLEVPESETAGTVISFFERLEEVLYCHKNKKIRAFGVPNDPNYSLQWGLTKAKGINMEEAWDIAGSSGLDSVVIAVIDTGVDYNHEDLKNKMWESFEGYCGWDFVNNDNFPMDDYGHGTHVAGIAAAATNNNTGIAGVAINPKIMALKVLDSDGYGEEYDEIEAILWAVRNRADVINMSLGTDTYSATEADACNYAFENDVFVCAATGNDNFSSVSYPAALGTVFAVGAVDDTFTASGGKASFSNYGNKLDVVAPGDSIYSTMPSYSVTLNSEGYQIYYDYMSGTSMACPFVAGLAALVLSERPDFGPGDVAEIIRRTASNYPVKNYYTGYGIINASACIAALNQHIANLLVEVTPFPNPFRSGAGIKLKFGFKNNPQTLKIFKIFDFTGQEVAELGSSDFYPDNQVASWDGKNKSGDYVASGVYFYYAETDTGKSKGRFAVIK